MKPVKSRREEYSDATRQALIDSATALFAEKGYARTSLDEVAGAARVTKGALYWHFPGKSALFRAVLDEQETAVVARILDSAAAAGDPWAACIAAVCTFLDACCDPVYGQIVMREGPVALGYGEWRECEDKYMYGSTVALLQALVDAGVVEPLPMEAAARVAFGMLGSAALTIAEHEGDAQQQVRGDLERVLIRILDGLRVRGS